MGSYRKPRRLNALSMFLLLCLAGAGYWLWVFFPVYWNAWTVDHQLREGAAQLYKLNIIAEPDRTREMQKLLKKTQDECIRLAHITDPEFEIVLEMEGENLVMHADYAVTVRHPVGNWVTQLSLKRSEAANVKRVTWE